MSSTHDTSFDAWNEYLGPRARNFYGVRSYERGVYNTWSQAKRCGQKKGRHGPWDILGTETYEESYAYLLEYTPAEMESNKAVARAVRQYAEDAYSKPESYYIHEAIPPLPGRARPPRPEEVPAWTAPIRRAVPATPFTSQPPPSAGPSTPSVRTRTSTPYFSAPGTPTPTPTPSSHRDRRGPASAIPFSLESLSIHPTNLRASTGKAPSQFSSTTGLATSGDSASAVSTQSLKLEGWMKQLLRVYHRLDNEQIEYITSQLSAIPRHSISMVRSGGRNGLADIIKFGIDPLTV